MRQYDCEKYGACLTEAAMQNRQDLGCQLCDDYRLMEATENEDPFITHLKGRKVIEDKEIKTGKQCKAPDCQGEVKARGLCRLCYDGWRRSNPELVALMGGPFRIIRPQIKKQEEKAIKVDHPPKEKEPENKGELAKVQKVIRILVAAEILTDEQVQAAYQMAGV
uniref:Uncharacterized protein n=1 Tax=viral metagenome TaxID=1070528 RepID=A0A6H2A6K7_9ZZZZ